MDLDRLRRHYQESIQDLSSELDEITVKGLNNPKPTQFKRMLYARLDKLETRLTLIEQRLTLVFKHDRSASKMEEAESLINDTKMDLFKQLDWLQNGKRSRAEIAQMVPGWKLQISFLTNMLEDVVVQKEELRELHARKRIAYAQLELLMCELKQIGL
eukprot:Platyproteum_vivax@DN6247_c0_g1_i1.p2